MRRAALSLTNNIAEGHGRFHFLDQIKFTLQSRGSLEELIDDLNACEDEQYLPKQEISALKDKGWRVRQLIDGYIRYLRAQLNSGTPVVKDLITNVSWNFLVKRRIKPFKPRQPDAPDGTWRMQQADIDRVQEFRKCIECFLCQDVCHVLRDHQMHNKFIGPRFLIHVAALEMHPLDTEDRLEELRNAQGIGYCNITKCCTKVCPENIEITDNGIIPLKERVVDKFYDPFGWFWRWLKRRQDRQPPKPV